MDAGKIAPLFAGWEEALIWSCLQGCMGRALADDDQNPAAAQIVAGAFCFFAGRPDEALAKRAEAPVMVPRDENWAALLESVWEGRAVRTLRYAIRKESGVFDREKLAGLTKKLPAGCALRPFDREIYGLAAGEAWSRDLCGLFESCDAFLANGLGVAAVGDGELLAGAASYAFYRGGIEIEIDTKPAHRRKGLAAACGAGLILACLERGLYPSWDAANLSSVALAEKLGYHLDRPYTVYIKTGPA